MTRLGAELKRNLAGASWKFGEVTSHLVGSTRLFAEVRRLFAEASRKCAETTGILPETTGILPEATYCHPERSEGSARAVPSLRSG